MNMRKIFFILLLIIPNIVGSSQIIKGTILDKNTNNPVSFAAVYFSGTLTGSLSDQNGHFELDVTKYLTMPLTISALGYNSVILSDFTTEKSLLIYLSPKVYELNEVVISAKSKKENWAYKEDLDLFKIAFLGLTDNALKCKITNEKDLNIVYNSETKILRVSTSKPILIDNKSLGYKITYYLDNFEASKTTGAIFFNGNIQFKEYPVSNKRERAKFERRRESAYLGSRMHFFRELWNNNLDSSGFTLKDVNNNRLAYDDIVISTDTIVQGVSKKYLKYFGKILLGYHTKDPKSAIVMVNEYVSFDKNGYFDPLGMNWQGEMARYRVADFLPYEYKSKH
jgi:hypothetical protein